jgi:hypothetical protein
MRTYQTLSLIGCILGILLTIGLFVTESVLVGTGQVFLNMSKSISTNTTANTINQQKYDVSKAAISPFMGGLAFAFLLYIVGLVITFVVKNTKAIDISLLGIGVIAMVITNGWGLIAFALLLPAGIVALRHKVNAAASITTATTTTTLGR